MPLSRLQKLVDDSLSQGGRWALNRNHELEYRGRGVEEFLSLKGPVIAAHPEALLFSVSEKTSDKKLVTRLLRLSGRWKTDSRNRIIFEVEKKSGRSDELVFDSAWQLNERYELAYRYKQTDLKTRRRHDREITFSGIWDFSEKNQLVFLIGGDDQAQLRFRGSFQTPSLLAKRGEIRYQVGGELRAARRKKTLIFFGKWKVSRDFALSFELESSSGIKKILRFGGQWNFDASNEIAVDLLSTSGKPLGVEVVFSRDFFKGGEMFTRFLYSPEESRIEAGARWKI